MFLKSAVSLPLLSVHQPAVDVFVGEFVLENIPDIRVKIYRRKV